MHVEAITLRKAAKRLTALGELELFEGGQGNALVRYAMVRMMWDGGIVYAEKGGAAAAATSALKDRSSLQPPSPEIEVTAGAGVATSVLRDRSSPQLPSSEIEAVDADPFMYLEEEGTRTTSDGDGETGIFDNSMTVDEQRAALFDTVACNLHIVDQFCEWWPGAYKEHRHGVQNRIRPRDREAAEVLAIGRTLKRLQAMAIELWSLRGNYTRADVSYIATSGREICVLLTKATIIESEVVRLRLDEPSDPRAEQQEEWSDLLAAFLERVLAKLSRVIADTSSPSLGEQFARVASELSTLDVSDRQRAIDRLEALDAEMLQAARATVSDDQLQQLQAEADTELAGFREKMPREAYQRSRGFTIDRLVRERFDLPSLDWTRVAGGRSSTARQERTAS